MEELDRVLSRYATSQERMDQLRYTADSVRLGFDRWGEQYVRGPDVYLLLVSETNLQAYTDPIGSNRDTNSSSTPR